MVKVGNISFDDDGNNNDTSTPDEVYWGEKIKSWNDGGWHYEYWRYCDRIIGLQWNGNSYVSAWLADESDVGIAGLNASAKKSMNNASFTDMVAKQREKNKGIKKGDWQTDGIIAIEGLKSPKDIANEIWGDLTNLIADACDDASYGVDTPTEISGGLAGDYYSKVAEALIPMLQRFIDEEKWR